MWQDTIKHTINNTFSGLTGHMSETRKLVVAISLSGSAVSFSFTDTEKENI